MSESVGGDLDILGRIGDAQENRMTQFVGEK